jgi:hypothetical protein
MALTTVKLTAGVTGTLPIANGGTNSTSTTFVNLASNVTGTMPVANGGTALTSGFVNGGALTEADTWRLTSALTTTGAYLTANLERDDTYGNGLLGTGMSESSGEFTFPSTGFWKVYFQMNWHLSTDVRWANNKISVTTDNASYNVAAVGATNGNASAGYECSCATEKIVDVTDVANVKVKLYVSCVSSQATWYSTSDNAVFATFIRLGDT